MSLQARRSTTAVRALVDGGADLTAVSGEIHRNEPVGWAIVSGASEAVRALLECGAAVTNGHRTDAEAGARGEFRRFNRDRPVEKWVQIRDTLP